MNRLDDAVMVGDSGISLIPDIVAVARNLGIKHFALAFISFFLVSGAVLAGPPEIAVEESGKTFPAQVMFSHAGKDYAMTLTGTAIRKKLVFKVYALAHYMQDAQQGSKDTLLKEAMTDGKAKQITMTFLRDVDAEKIVDAFREGFKKNATQAELTAIQPHINTFCGYFDKANVKEGQQFILRWLPAGVVLTNVLSQEKPAIADETFARILWSIWLGPDSIVKAGDLVKAMTSK